ncbi:MAG: beta-lactamase family protein [Anaerolineae bacterium]|nr:beta-lactamase family protein [Anaerolineae bacterium]
MISNDDPRFTSVRIQTASIQEAARIPGMAIGVLQGDRMFTAGFGVTSTEHPLPVTADTLFQIGSITKVYTGAAMMRLVDRGKIHLDAPVQTYLPAFRVADPVASATVTVRHLLTHTVGWPSDVFDFEPEDYESMSAFLRRMPEVPQIASPGTWWTYANSGFLVAGCIIEKLMGKPFVHAIRELVCEPLGLYYTSADPGMVMTYRFAAGHYEAEEGLRVVRPWPLPGCAISEGGIAASIADLLRFARFHLGDGRSDEGRRFLKPASLAEMQRSQFPIWEPHEWVGLTWFISDREGTRILSHGGRTPGAQAELVLVPEHHFACAVLTNAAHGLEACRSARDHILQTFLSLNPPTPPEPLPATRETVAALEGHYRHPYFTLDLVWHTGQLHATISSPLGIVPSEDSRMTCALWAPDRLVVLDGFREGVRFDLLRRPDGSIGWLRDGDTLYAREDR